MYIQETINKTSIFFKETQITNKYWKSFTTSVAIRGINTEIPFHSSQNGYYEENK